MAWPSKKEHDDGAIFEEANQTSFRLGERNLEDFLPLLDLPNPSRFFSYFHLPTESGI